MRGWWILLGLAMACGSDDPATSTTMAGSGTTATPTSTGDGPGATGMLDSTTTGAAVPCSMHTDETACLAGDPGGGQVCGWVSYYPVTAEGEPPDLQCTYGDPAGICVQQLGDEGGTPFGSCGGDGTPPVYWRDDGGSIELVMTDGFFTPDGWSACDCHDGTPDPADPAACCCACFGMLPA